MVESHERFFPDNVDEQIEACRQRPALASVDTRLIHDLYHLYQEDARIISNVWKRLSNYIPQGRIERSTSFLPIHPESPEWR
jgi:diketogulonate reductase-like aldo/keto reductase